MPTLSRLDLAGGKMLLSELLEDLETSLGVTLREVVPLLNSKEFNRFGGWIMRAVVGGEPGASQVEQSVARDKLSAADEQRSGVRTETSIRPMGHRADQREAISVAKSPADTGKCFFGVLQWWFRLDISSRLLGGLDAQVPPGVMALFEIQPGTRRDFNAGEIRFSWTGAQPSIGVAGTLFRRLRAEVGDVIWLCPLYANKVHLRFARYPDDVSEAEEIAFLAGLDLAVYDAKSLLISLSSAIDKKDVKNWPELLAALQARGDLDIVCLAENLLGFSQRDKITAHSASPVPKPTKPSVQPIWHAARKIGNVQSDPLNVPGDALQADMPNVPSVDDLFKVLKGNRRG